MPRERFVETNPRIDVWELHRCGALVDGTVTELRWGEKTCQLAARTPNVWFDGTCVLIVWDMPMEGVDRCWFECPACQRRARHLYLRDPIACRRCNGLKYLAENMQQTSGVGRVERLRRKLGADPHPFAPLPAGRPGRHKADHQNLVAMIQAEEQALVEYLGGIVHDLRRRIGRPRESGRLALMDHDKIVNKRVRRIAQDHGCTVDQVHAALDHHPIELDRDTFLKRTLAMELVELDELQAAFRDKALVDRDVPAGVLLIKVAERRATLLGLNPPIGHAVQVIQHVPEYQKTTTDEIEAAIDHVVGITSRERALANKQNYSDEKLTAEEQSEFDQLRTEREANRLAKLRCPGPEPSTTH